MRDNFAQIVEHINRLFRLDSMTDQVCRRNTPTHICSYTPTYTDIYTYIYMCKHRHCFQPDDFGTKQPIVNKIIMSAGINLMRNSNRRYQEGSNNCIIIG
eukprot:GHVU01055922.1.p1 GENE.GHVU01055922.1~~GHVU01055922.1.p1  ORF type:complete len:100 (+),score=4.88 GHVU01055922.1:86-385(+)